MLKRLQRNFTLVLARLLQMSPAGQMRWVLATLIFVILLNMASNSLDALIGLPPWLTLSLLLGLILIPFTWISLREILNPHEVPVISDPPQPRRGLILFLSLFHAWENKQKSGFAGQVWRFDELNKALGQPEPDWPLIIERFEQSNMQPALEAIRHHSGALQHVWLITTPDQTTDRGRQRGSHRLAPLFERIINAGIGIDVTFHYTDPHLEVPTYDVGAAYSAVHYVYTIAAPQIGLQPHDVMADLTGGRVPMTGGMILACAPRGWPMQYTTTDRDPAKHAQGDKPIPLAIEVDAWEVRRSALEAAAGEATSKGD